MRLKPAPGAPGVCLSDCVSVSTNPAPHSTKVRILTFLRASVTRSKSVRKEQNQNSNSVTPKVSFFLSHHPKLLSLNPVKKKKKKVESDGVLSIT